MSDDLALQLNIALRLVIAAAFGAVVGVEREVHGHSAGFRTHTLVSVGSAMFTVLSIYGFPAAPGQPVDPTRIAAQIVTGIGFLGAGAILKSGPTVHGLTTAASLWSVAAIGMAAGAGAWVVAGVGTLIVVFVLWPLNAISKWIERHPRRPVPPFDPD
jgi:putative Mg2+ transporter-C (MgtC) family protein